jgi:hypothetical protein
MKIFKRKTILSSLNRSALHMKNLLLLALSVFECENANSAAESSSASLHANSSNTSVVSNSSAEETTHVTDKNAGLKELYVTGMYKSLKGHQTLCDVLKKQILNRNPRKEGIAFERKLNADGTYWKPDQYPKTTWVAAKGSQVDLSTLSGYTCDTSYSSDESFDSNYKLFKNQNGVVFAWFIGTNCRNSSPVKKIWVPKSLLENLQVNVIMTPPMRKKHPRANSSHGRKSSTDRRPTNGHTNASFSQGNHYRSHDYVHYSSNHYVHKSLKNFSAYSYQYSSVPVKKRSAYASLPKFSINAQCFIASQPPIQMWVVKKN